MLIYRSSPRRAILAMVLSAVLLLPAWAWGPKGHTMIAVAAITGLPSGMPAFVYDSTTIGYLANEPDRWRGRDIAALSAVNAPDHFLDLEPVAFLPVLPGDRYRFMAALERRAAELRASGHERQAAALRPARVGFQPYATIEAFQRLVRAFQEYRAAGAQHRSTRPMQVEALMAMGVLAHFVGDGAQPLHTTVNYNGWVEANPEGFTTSHRLHAAFESQFVDQAIPAAALKGKLQPAVLVPHPFRDYVKYLKATHAQVLPLYQLEKVGAFDGRGTAPGRAFVIARLASGAQMLADLYYTAWVVSGQQQPDHLLQQ
jgi:hypothetical protein